MDGWPRLLPPGTILTPHPGEFARLARLDREKVQADRVALAAEKAAEWNCVVVLKGAFTVVAAPDGQIAVEPFATSALASAGTGDVLAGAIAGLLAQGLAPFDAALCAAWLHGMAGVRAAGCGDPISTAGDVGICRRAGLAARLIRQTSPASRLRSCDASLRNRAGLRRSRSVVLRSGAYPRL